MREIPDSVHNQSKKGAAEVLCLRCIDYKAELCEGFSSVIAEPRNKKYNVVFFVESINYVDQ